jgi:aryl carrier-like protein
VEKLLADIWAGVLKLEHVGIHDNFFDLGGDSILGTQILARATRAGLRVTPRQLFQFQTIAGLAEAIGAGAVATLAKASSPDFKPEVQRVTVPAQKTKLSQEDTDKVMAQTNRTNGGRPDAN